MATNPGTVMEYLAFEHPFLDGNGRPIMVIHCVLAHRAGKSIDWASTIKTEYLPALSRELKDPDQGHLDAYLRPFVGKALKESALPGNITGAPGLDGEGEDRVLGKTDDANSHYAPISAITSGTSKSGQCANPTIRCCAAPP